MAGCDPAHTVGDWWEGRQCPPAATAAITFTAYKPGSYNVELDNSKLALLHLHVS